MDGNVQPVALLQEATQGVCPCINKFRKIQAVGNLGSWATVYIFQGQAVRRENTYLLECVGSEWDPCKDAWMEMYGHLMLYKTKFGSTRVPNQWEKDPQLGTWVKTQRRICRESYRIHLLNVIEFDWNPRKN